jgi:hypothetical protein
MKYMVGVPSVGQPTWPLFDSLINLESPDGNIRYARCTGLAVDLARNVLVDEFLLSECDALLFVDGDAGLHPGTLKRLASWNVPIVGALAFGRYTPMVPTICAGAGSDPSSYVVRIDETVDWLKHHPDLIGTGPAMLDVAPADSLRPLHEQGGFTGGHCLLVRREVLEAIEPPWFLRKPGARGTQEDRYFCEKVIAAGFPLYVDRSVVAGHVYGDRQAGGLDFLAWDMVTNWQTMGFHVGAKPSE